MKAGKHLLVTLLQGGYWLLLRVYPRSFRDEFAGEMHRVFSATLEDSAARGPAAVAEVWFREVGTYPFNLAHAYFHSWGEEKPVRLGRPGLAFLSAWTVLSALAPVAAFAISIPFWRALILVLGPTIVRYGHSSATEDALGLFIFFPTLGLILGIVQALLLRRYVAGARRWLLAIVAGWAAVLAFYELTIATARLTEVTLNPTVRTWLPLVALGLLSGGLQWLFFRRALPGAVWFFPAALLGVAYIPASRDYLGETSLLGQLIGFTAVPGFLSGLTAVLLLRNRGGTLRGTTNGEKRKGPEGEGSMEQDGGLSSQFAR